MNLSFQKKSCINSNNRGYTLIEVLVGSVLLLLVIAGVSAFIAGSSDLGRQENLRRRAFQVMGMILEDSSNCSGFSGNQYVVLKNKITTLGTMVNGNMTWIPADTSVVLSTFGPVNGTMARRYRILTGYDNGFGTIEGINIRLIMRWNDGVNRYDTLSKVITSVRG